MGAPVTLLDTVPANKTDEAVSAREHTVLQTSSNSTLLLRDTLRRLNGILSGTMRTIFLLPIVKAISWGYPCETKHLVEQGRGFWENGSSIGYPLIFP